MGRGSALLHRFLIDNFTPIFQNNYYRMGKSILFLVPYPAGQAPSQRFRFEQYLQALRNAGAAISLQSFWDESTWRILYQKGHTMRKSFGFLLGKLKRVYVLLSLHKYDFVFIHREVLPIGPPVLEWMIAKVFKKKIIYDFDDAIWLPNTSENNQIVSALKWHRKVRSICRWSYKVSCGNEYLAAYARQFNTRVILNPSTIDTELLHNPSLFGAPPERPLTIGWTGSHSTLSYLNQFQPVLKWLEDHVTVQFRFLVIADQAPSLKFKSLEYLPWKKETEMEDLMKIDIGIMPLMDDPWAKGKCGFKILQYMALGIPTVASPVGVNTKIIAHGANGFLCNSVDEWQKSLESLIASKELRLLIGSAGRKNVIENYSVSSNTGNFLSLFE
jgi:glycosyltransferase involved in cell wall biosynthesis